MMIAPNTALRLIQRAERLREAAEVAGDVICTLRFMTGDSSAITALYNAAVAIQPQANAWDCTVLDREWGDTIDRLLTMLRHPHQFSAAELLANRKTLGMPERWCRERAGSRGAIVAGGNNPDYSAEQVMA